MVATSRGVEGVPATVGQDHGHVAPAIQSDGVNTTLFARVPKVAVTRVGGSIEMVAELARGHEAKRANGR